MYLLILVSRFHRIEWRMVFTFHNVSINSAWKEAKLMGETNLHSIMYLLIPAAPACSNALASANLHSIMYLLILTAGTTSLANAMIYIP